MTVFLNSQGIDFILGTQEYIVTTYIYRYCLIDRTNGRKLFENSRSMKRSYRSLEILAGWGHEEGQKPLKMLMSDVP